MSTDPHFPPHARVPIDRTVLPMPSRQRPAGPPTSFAAGAARHATVGPKDEPVDDDDMDPQDDGQRPHEHEDVRAGWLAWHASSGDGGGRWPMACSAPSRPPIGAMRRWSI